MILKTIHFISIGWALIIASMLSIISITPSPLAFNERVIIIAANFGAGVIFAIVAIATRSRLES
jgi:hypothetical protein